MGLGGATRRDARHPHRLSSALASVSPNAVQVIRNVIAATAALLKERHSFDRAELSRLKSAVQSTGTKAKGIDGSALRSSCVLLRDHLGAQALRAFG
jgi:hypothetical protein